ARDRLPHVLGLQDGPLRCDHGRDRGLLRRVSRAARLARRRAPRVHRRRCHRVPRRRGGRARGPPRPPLHDALRPSTERPPISRPRLSRGRADAPRPVARPPPQHPDMAVARLAILGTGLIGASIGLAARRAGVTSVAGFDEDESMLATAVERGAVDEPAASLEQVLSGAELAVVAVPVAQLADEVGTVLTAAPDGCTVTDVGSTKQAVCETAGGSPRFVGGHPVCGSEARGAEHASADLFEGATWFLTPLPETDPGRYRLVHGFVAGLGA